MSLITVHNCVDPKITLTLPTACKCRRRVRVRVARKLIRSDIAFWVESGRGILLKEAFARQVFSVEPTPTYQRVRHSVDARDIESAYASEGEAAKFQASRIEAHGELQARHLGELGAVTDAGTTGIFVIEVKASDETEADFRARRPL